MEKRALLDLCRPGLPARGGGTVEQSLAGSIACNALAAPTTESRKAMSSRDEFAGGKPGGDQPKDVQAYIAAISAEHRPLFDRLDRLIRSEFPDVDLSISYGILTYRVGRRRLYIGAWRHGLSIYGWRAGVDGGFAERHPELLSGKSTIRVSPSAADGVSDEAISDLIRASLSG